MEAKWSINKYNIIVIVVVVMKRVVICKWLMIRNTKKRGGWAKEKVCVVSSNDNDWVV